MLSTAEAAVTKRIKLDQQEDSWCATSTDVGQTEKDPGKQAILNQKESEGFQVNGRTKERDYCEYGMRRYVRSLIQDLALS